MGKRKRLYAVICGEITGKGCPYYKAPDIAELIGTAEEVKKWLKKHGWKDRLSYQEKLEIIVDRSGNKKYSGKWVDVILDSEYFAWDIKSKYEGYR